MSAAEDLCALNVCGQGNRYERQLHAGVLNVVPNPREQVHVIHSLLDACLLDGYSSCP